MANKCKPPRTEQISVVWVAEEMFSKSITLQPFANYIVY